MIGPFPVIRLANDALNACQRRSNWTSTAQTQDEERSALQGAPDPEAYSRGLFEEVECDDCGDCLGEGGEGSSVVGV
ncbi:hypothetical protein, partial [Rathayibacter iranicus]